MDKERYSFLYLHSPPSKFLSNFFKLFQFLLIPFHLTTNSDKFFKPHLPQKTMLLENC